LDLWLPWGLGLYSLGSGSYIHYLFSGNTIRTLLNVGIIYIVVCTCGLRSCGYSSNFYPPCSLVRIEINTVNRDKLCTSLGKSSKPQVPNAVDSRICSCDLNKSATHRGKGNRYGIFCNTRTSRRSSGTRRTRSSCCGRSSRSCETCGSSRSCGSGRPCGSCDNRLWSRWSSRSCGSRHTGRTRHTGRARHTGGSRDDRLRSSGSRISRGSCRPRISRRPSRSRHSGRSRHSSGSLSCRSCRTRRSRFSSRSCKSSRPSRSLLTCRSGRTRRARWSGWSRRACWSRRSLLTRRSCFSL